MSSDAIVILKEDVLESYEEHHVADVLCLVLTAEAGPHLREPFQLQELGTRLEEARKKAPRKPSQPSALEKTVDAVIS